MVFKRCVLFRVFLCAATICDGMDRLAVGACEVNVVLAVVRQLVIADVIATVTRYLSC